VSSVHVTHAYLDPSDSLPDHQIRRLFANRRSDPCEQVSLAMISDPQYRHRSSPSIQQ
jgi:hypothetical protein